MALSSSTPSTPAALSPFPETTPVALASPEPVVAVRSQYYDNSPAFSEDTSYHNTPASDPSSTYKSLTLPRSSSVFGTRVLSAISENHPGVVAKAAFLSRKASQSVRGKSLSNFVNSFQTTTTEEEQEGSLKSPRRTLGDIFTPRRSSLAPSEDDEESEYIMPYKPSFTGGAGRQSESQAPAKPATTRGFSWFGSLKQAPSPPPAMESNIGTDLITGAPAALLFPPGSLQDKSPASFDELLANAETLIHRLQSVNKAQATALSAARAEREATSEEAEEAETRARHLKIQLDDLAAKQAEQDALNRALAEELAAEKQRRHEDREAFERQARQNELTLRRSRHSGASIASDSGFESEADTASSCSRPHTPTSPNASNFSNERWGAAMETIKEIRPVSRDSQTARIPSRTCEVDAGVWSFMREEKVRLERRVHELEGALDGCLDLIA